MEGVREIRRNPRMSKRVSAFKGSIFASRDNSVELVQMGVGATSSLFPISCVFSIFLGISIVYIVTEMELTFVDSFYFIIVTVSTVGYGDIAPTTM